MKVHLWTAGRWVALAGIFIAIGALMAVGSGRRRGTKAYGWRIALWGLAVALMSGGALLVSQAQAGKKPPSKTIAVDGEKVSHDEPRAKCYDPMPPPKCYKPLPPPEEDPEEVKPPDPPPTCYAPMPTCYEPMPPEPPTPPEVQPTCYEAMPPEPPPEPPPPEIPTCYAPMPPPDPGPDESKTEAPEDPQMLCYY